MRLAALLAAAALLLPAMASAQTPPPDERAAAQAFAEAAKRLLAAATEIEEPAWLESCRALRADPPSRHEDDANAYLQGLVMREAIDELKPHVLRLRSELAQAQTTEPALISGRAALRRLGRMIATLPTGEPDPCAAYRAYTKAGYPRRPADEARALSDRLDTLLTRGIERRIRAAGDRMEALGISRDDAEAFSSLAD